MQTVGSASASRQKRCLAGTAGSSAPPGVGRAGPSPHFSTRLRHQVAVPSSSTRRESLRMCRLSITHCTFNDAEGDAEIVYFPYQSMTEDDLFTLVRPSGQSQGPKLRDAIKSLKLLEAAGGAQIAGLNLANGLIVKQNRPRAPFFTALDQYKLAVHSPFCKFNIFNLPDQIKNECVWSTGQQQPANWGGVENNSLSYCETLVSRIRTMIHSAELSCLFQQQGKSLVDQTGSVFRQ